MNLDDLFDRASSEGNTTRGLVSGLIGGLAGTAVKAAVERFLDVRKIDQKTAQMKIIDDLSTKITGSPVNTGNEGIAEQLVRIPLGVSVGAAYGYSKKDETEANILDGAVLGATTWASTHESTLPLIGLQKSDKEIPVKTQLQELFSHVLFGITTEVVRSYVNERLKEREDSRSYEASDSEGEFSATEYEDPESIQAN